MKRKLTEQEVIDLESIITDYSEVLNLEEYDILQFCIESGDEGVDLQVYESAYEIFGDVLLNRQSKTGYQRLKVLQDNQEILQESIEGIREALLKIVNFVEKINNPFSGFSKN